MYVPTVKKEKSQKMQEEKISFKKENAVLSEIERMKDELAKRNRDHDDLLYNLDLSNFAPQIRDRLSKVLNNTNNTSEEGGNKE